ncbi:MAG: threonylcarbamoyl-AMP synthase [Candidatus Portnoybacteria bacterium CG03_land_8_20_14_0_80_41_10]|uniref:L-threonylcarbamoyladenylate synthase n=1 Tax=Candidatus Portnoybacteria bacterium CG03_land_8_20_14_0_80_41_10 TaxID=1974808 RepID=A0A2M7BUF4_9BACT|nr:MAG: threonylcarbamoyl-AMP synthase [Candidatus Portnoybacteria bacterium CG03_land_8_20_14_0_80_41_10]
MEIIKIDLSIDWPDPFIIKKAAGVIQAKGSLVYPTDTVYGLGVDGLSVPAIERLFKIKKRPASKPVPVIVRDMAMAKRLALIDRQTERILEAVWPGPVTVILRKKEIVPDILTAGQSTIGLRIPDCKLVRAIMNNLEGPMTATSANFSGQPSLTSSNRVIETFNRAYPRPDLILAARHLPASPPSTVLDLTGPQPKILRVGPTNKNDLLKLLRT